MDLTSPETPAPPVNIQQWRLSDLLWLSFAIPISFYYVFESSGGAILVEFGFNVIDIQDLGFGIGMSLIAFIVLGALFIFLLRLFFARRHHKKPPGFLFMLGLQAVAFLVGQVSSKFTPSLMARAESNAIWCCKIFASAEDTFRRADHNGDGVLEYATTLKELYDGGKLNLVSQKMAEAEGPNGTPYYGYRFKVLTAQGKNAPGGARSYFDPAGHFRVGYALLAWPAEYGRTAKLCFVIASSDTLYQKDWGADTQKKTEAYVEFDPQAFGESWVRNE